MKSLLQKSHAKVAVIECCAAGPTENSIPRRVLEYWHRCFDERYIENRRIKDPAAYFEWVRDRTLEVDIRPAWVRD
jgi:hypothetical protein